MESLLPQQVVHSVVRGGRPLSLYRVFPKSQRSRFPVMRGGILQTLVSSQRLTRDGSRARRSWAHPWAHCHQTAATARGQVVSTR